MALDGAFLHCLLDELRPLLLDARVDKIHQPSREEVVLCVRTHTGNRKLLISAVGQSPRLHFTSLSLDNPPVPPMFCLLLRKRLTGARITAVHQPGMERIVHLTMSNLNELGDAVELVLTVELMGQHANVILTQNGRIVDALKRVDPAASPDRPLIPGWPYLPPPVLADRLDVSAVSADDIAARAVRCDRPLSGALREVTQGLSPLLCREIAHLATRGRDTDADRLTAEENDRLRFYLQRVQTAILTGEHRSPVLLYDARRQPLEFSFMPITQYGLSAVSSSAADLSEVLDRFYAEKDAATRLRQRSHDILRVLKAAADRATRKLQYQQQEWERSVDRDRWRLYGDLLTAQAHTLPRGAAYADVPNYYEPDMPTVRIPLDPTRSAVQNAQKYYKDYRKAQTAEQKLAEQIGFSQQEIAYIDTVFDALSRAATLRELEELRAELIAQGYLQPPAGRRKPPAPLAPLTFVSDDGFRILVGRNNLQNDQLTLRIAHGGDLWFHVKNQPGSHTVLVTDGAVPSDLAKTQAAQLAAWHSRAAASSGVAVDYTAVRHVRKPSGARPGLVIYDHQQTVYVTPDPLLAPRLQTTDSRRTT